MAFIVALASLSIPRPSVLLTFEKWGMGDFK
jgi:hypothetical protein